LNVGAAGCETPCLAGSLEDSDEFLPRVNRDDRLAVGQRALHALVELREPSIAIRVAPSFAHLAVGLQAELLLMQQITDGGIGSRRASGSTIASRSASSVGSFSMSGLPLPGRQTRSQPG